VRENEENNIIDFMATSSLPKSIKEKNLKKIQKIVTVVYE
jgi:hypothetical protein